MISKRFILNADDFGFDQYHNQAVLEGYINGFLTSASLMTNMQGFESAVNDILPDCGNLSIGAHLNIIEGKSLTKCKKITDDCGNFDKGYLYFLINQNDKDMLEEIEQEFRAQIEKAKSCVKITHIE